MKLWTTVDLGRLPGILQNGIDNPSYAEISVSPSPQLVAEHAFEGEDELAFLELDIPDDQLDEFLVTCMASHGDDQSNMEMELESAIEEGNQEQVAQLQSWIQAMEAAETAKDYLEAFGYTCLYKTVPPSMLKLLDPGIMLEALRTGDAVLLASAVQNTEATAFKSLGAAFWVWLMMLMGQIMGPGYGRADEGEGEEERLEKMREKAAKRPRQKRTRKKKVSPSA